jgi:branched-chain amino acid transport system substrate-binding protein
MRVKECRILEAPFMSDVASPTCAAVPLTILVRPDGSVEEAVPSYAKHFLAANKELARYAQAFLGSGAHSVGFFWMDAARRWLRVWLEAAPELDEDGALLTMTPCPLPAQLTSRELDVLTLVACGLSNREIAGRLVTSNRTVSTHVEHILAKLGQTSRSGAAAVAVGRGYLRMPIPGHGPPPDGLTIGVLQVSADARTVPWAGRQASPRRVKRPLLIGSAFPLSGPAASDGAEMVNGSALAIAEINARGGIGGRRVEQVIVDVDVFSANSVRQAFERLFAAEVHALTSGYLFPEDAAREMAAGYGAPYLHATTSESQARIVRDNHERYRNIFQVCPTELHYGPGFIRFLNQARQAGWQPDTPGLAFIESPLPSGQMLNPVTVALAERSGWQIVSVQTAPVAGADWPDVVDRLARAQPCAVMITQYLPGELAVFQLLASRRLPRTVVYAVYTPSVPQFLELAGEAAEGLVWSTVTGTYSDLIAQAFRESYERAAGRPPGRSHAGIAYDEVHLLAQAWMAVSNPFHYQEVSGQLRRSRYRGVNGAYFLDNAAQTGLAFPDVTPDPSLGQAHLVFQIQHGTHRIIGPQPYADSSFRPPARAVQPVS